VFAEPAKLFPLSYELIKTGVIDAGLLVTHILRLEETDKLKDLFAEDRPVIKAVITAE
jgi:L-iditol 2-dehydrogenase